jgi:hypothetical protein
LATEIGAGIVTGVASGVVSGSKAAKVSARAEMERFQAASDIGLIDAALDALANFGAKLRKSVTDLVGGSDPTGLGPSMNSYFDANLKLQRYAESLSEEIRDDAKALRDHAGRILSSITTGKVPEEELAAFGKEVDALFAKLGDLRRSVTV